MASGKALREFNILFDSKAYKSIVINFNSGVSFVYFSTNLDPLCKCKKYPSDTNLVSNYESYWRLQIRKSSYIN